MLTVCRLENGGATLKPNDSSGTVSEQQQLEVNRRIQQRRAKSFRGGRPSGSFRVPVCPVTGLTSTQKRLIEARWHELDKQAVLELGRNVFETLFRREPRFLQALGLRHLAGPRINEWRFHVNFRVQVQVSGSCRPTGAGRRPGSWQSGSYFLQRR